jgi:hypothetical protein
MRFMRIDAGTGEALRDFWQFVEPALPDILAGFYRHVTSESWGLGSSPSALTN